MVKLSHHWPSNPVTKFDLSEEMDNFSCKPLFYKNEVTYSKVVGNKITHIASGNRNMEVSSSNFRTNADSFLSKIFLVLPTLFLAKNHASE